jgi:uncharacterized protein YecE (DUF72 family)
MASIRVGISGWRYPPWRGAFYPKGLPQRAELAYAASRLPLIEINGSFYSLQLPQSYARWYRETPPEFVFAVKGSRYITHMLRLRNIQTPLANFFASGLFHLKEKLGPILWQFPQAVRFDAQRFEAFLKLLPRTTGEASRLARRRDGRLKGRARLAIDRERPMRHAVEIRHESFLVPEFVAMLREHGVALVVAETAQRWPLVHDVTADFMYLRLHGDRELYRSGYSDRALDRWAERIRLWAGGSEPPGVAKITDTKPARRKARDVYCLFDNTDYKLRAPIDAQSLLRKLNVAQGTGSGVMMAVGR